MHIVIKGAKHCILCTFKLVSNNYGDVDWSAPLVTVNDLALIAVDESFQNKIRSQDGFTVIT